MSERIASLNFQRKAIADLKPHPRNPRVHPKPESPLWMAIKASLDHDYFDPLVWNQRNGYLVSGHLRCKVMVELGFTQVDVVVVDYDEATHLARMIAANQLLGKWEETLLQELAGDIDRAGLDAALAGYDTKHFMQLLEMPEINDDTASAEELMSRAEELQKEWKVQQGEIYQIGRHRLLCGDCSTVDNWQKLLGDRKGDMLWTDPPYNIDYSDLQEHRQKILKKRTRKAEPLLNDKASPAKYRRLLLEWFSTAAKIVKPGGAMYVAFADCHVVVTRQVLERLGWKISQTLIWDKPGFTIGRQDYQWKHEPILYGWLQGAGHYWQGGHSHATVWSASALKDKTKAELLDIIVQMQNDQNGTIIREQRSKDADLHPTVKPTPLVARHIWNSSRKGEVVVELFSGSGTTLVAAEQTGRQCVVTELDPKYCAVTLTRAQALGLPIERIPCHG